MPVYLCPKTRPHTRGWLWSVNQFTHENLFANRRFQFTKTLEYIEYECFFNAFIRILLPGHFRHIICNPKGLQITKVFYKLFLNKLFVTFGKTWIFLCWIVSAILWHVKLWVNELLNFDRKPQKSADIEVWVSNIWAHIGQHIFSELSFPQSSIFLFDINWHARIIRVLLFGSPQAYNKLGYCLRDVLVNLTFYCLKMEQFKCG